jgi:hypothetical protein
LRHNLYVCIIKGPSFPDQAMMQPYHIEGGAVTWDHPEPRTADMAFGNLIPTWWDSNPMWDAIEDSLEKEGLL